MMGESTHLQKDNRSHWPLTEIAAILHDPKQPVTLRTLQSWVTGQVLRIEPSVTVPGQKRKRYGMASLINFLIAKQLLHCGFHTRVVQMFIDHYQDADFLTGVPSFKDKVEGYFIFIQDGEKDAKIYFYADENAFLTALRVLFAEGGSVPKWTSLHLGGLLKEAMERIDCWNRRVEYRTPGERIIKAFDDIRHFNLSHGLPVNAVREFQEAYGLPASGEKPDPLKRT
jgi:hypothetical protein